MSELPRATFRAMSEGTQEDWNRIMAAGAHYSQALPARVLEHLRLLAADHGGFAVDRLTHSLQCATRALRDGRDEEYVVCALLHDIGDTLAFFNHPDVAAAVLRPFVSAENHWVVKHHGIFQGAYYFHYTGADPKMRERYRGHPHFDACAAFCELYDQSAFDPSYDTLPLESFEPMVHRVLATPRYLEETRE